MCCVEGCAGREAATSHAQEAEEGLGGPMLAPMPVTPLNVRPGCVLICIRSVCCVLCGLQVRWITFHSGYDFGYLLKVLTCSPLPTSEAEFFDLLKVGGVVVAGRQGCPRQLGLPCYFVPFLLLLFWFFCSFHPCLMLAGGQVRGEGRGCPSVELHPAIHLQSSLCRLPPQRVHETSKFVPCLQIFFPTVYDIKYLMKFCDNLHGGLNKLAETLDVARIGPQHQVRCGGARREFVAPGAVRASSAPSLSGCQAAC